MAVNLFVNRLYVITDDGRVAYDEQFHHGVNIIRGANSSGKSTITHLLFYALGGDYTHFVAEARRCSRVMAEVTVSGATLTLSRPIDKDSEGRVLTQRGMTIHWGTLDEALSGTCQHTTCGYKTTASRQSFSNVLFEAMGMPVVQGDSNITMHQLLRLIYIDQESPTNVLFYYEMFDNQTTRETVADLLLGIFDAQLYEAKRRLKDLEADLTEVKADIRSLEKTLSPEQRSTETINDKIDSKRREIDQFSADIDCLRRGEDTDRQKKSQTEILKAEILRLEKEIARKEEEADLLEHDIEDTGMFVDELTRRQSALNHSIDTRRILGTLQLEYCPECLQPLRHDTPEGTCHLCRQPVDSTSGITQAKRLIAELTFQKQESEAILRHDEASLIAVRSRLRKLKSSRRLTRSQLDSLLGSVRSSKAEAIEDLMYRKGQCDGELLQYFTMLEMAEKYAQLQQTADRLEADIASTQRIIHTKQAQQERRRGEVMRKIQEHGAYFLQHDEERQKAFAQASPADFMVDFPGNVVFLHTRYDKYSASSSFFLKLAARFSLLFASLDIPWMRYPRFLFADNMEDKGIEVRRAQKFQQTLIDRLSHYDPDTYQVIYTTSYITEDLDRSAYVVGDHYDIHHKSLRNI